MGLEERGGHQCLWDSQRNRVIRSVAGGMEKGGVCPVTLKWVFFTWLELGGVNWNGRDSLFLFSQLPPPYSPS